MTKNKKIFFAAAAVIALAAGIYVVKRPAGGKSAVRETKVRRGDIAIRIRITGSVEPRNRLVIKPQVAGRIEDILVSEGSRVSKGEIIAWMSSSDRAALLDAARPKGADEIRKWEDAYKPTPVISPLDGFIIARSKEPGQAVGLSDEILVMADRLIVCADVDETDLASVKKDKKVIISLDAYPDKQFAGVVEHIAYESRLVNNVTVYEVKILPVKAPADFRSGMTANIELVAAKSDGTLLLPFDAVTERNGKKFVRRALPGKKYENIEIQTGLTDGKNIEITSGLAEGDIVTAPSRGGSASSRSGGSSSRSSSNSPARAMRFSGGR